MNNTQVIESLVKSMVDADEEFKQAQKIVNERKASQEKLKELFEQEGIEQYVLQKEGYFAVISFRKSTYKRVDIASLPEEIKQLYLKETIIRREIFNIISKP